MYMYIVHIVKLINSSSLNTWYVTINPYAIENWSCTGEDMFLTNYPECCTIWCLNFNHYMYPPLRHKTTDKQQDNSFLSLNQNQYSGKQKVVKCNRQYRTVENSHEKYFCIKRPFSWIYKHINHFARNNT